MPTNTAGRVWAKLNVTSIGSEFSRENKATSYTEYTCSAHPCGTGYCNTVQASNCCLKP